MTDDNLFEENLTDTCGMRECRNALDQLTIAQARMESNPHCDHHAVECLAKVRTSLWKLVRIFQP